MSSNCVSCGELIFEGETVCPACGTPKGGALPPSGADYAQDPDETGVSGHPVAAATASARGSAGTALKPPATRTKKKGPARPARFENKGIAPEHSARRHFKSNEGSSPWVAVALIGLTIGIIVLTFWVVGGGLDSEPTPRSPAAAPMAEDDVRRDYIRLNTFLSEDNRLIIILLTHNERLSGARCDEIARFNGELLRNYNDARTVTDRFRNEAHWDSWKAAGGRTVVRFRLNERDRNVYHERSFSVRRGD